MIKKSWSNINGNLFLRDVSSEVPHLENKVYNLNFDQKAGFYLTALCDKFEFGYKIYGLESKFIDRVMKTYKNTTGNMGLLLTGVKGTGKTVTAEIIANQLNLPVINITIAYTGISSYLADIKQDIVIFIDEYDKVYKGNVEYDIDEENENQQKADSSLLSIMDGSLNNEFRKVFILTTNRIWINENLLNRPGRIRYKKHFADLAIEQINEIINDLLVDKNRRESIIDYLKPLSLITVDIVKAVISQVNIFEENPTECCKDLNVQIKEDSWKIFKIDKDTEDCIDEEPNIAYVNAALNPSNGWKNRIIYIESNDWYIQSKPNYKEKIFVVGPNRDSEKSETMTIKIKKHIPVHKSFNVF